MSWRMISLPWLFRGLVFILAWLILPAASGADRSLVPSMFTPESTPAHSIRQLSLFTLAITGVIFAVVFGLIAYAAIRFRRRANDDGREPPQVYGSNPVEMAWTVVPLLIVVVSALDVTVIGHQWWWEIRYPKFGVVTANELHVPVSSSEKRAPTFMELRSAD